LIFRQKLYFYLTMDRYEKQLEKVQKILDETADNSKVFGTVVTLSNGNGDLIWTGSAGNLDADSLFFMASATKLYITATILKMRELGYFELSDTIASYFPEEITKGLHVYNGSDYSGKITIEHLMANTSGLPDYFQQKMADGESILDKIKSGKDLKWSFEDVVKYCKGMKPEFAPGEKGKAVYSDTNFQLLGKLIELQTELELSDALESFIFEPLGLESTYMYTNIKDKNPAAMYFKNTPFSIPKAMSSFGPDGGMVSNSYEMNVFLKAFFNGEIFPESYLEELYKWNTIFYPLEYGVGLARFKLPKLLSPFKTPPEFMGHSGLTGAFNFYNPDKDLYISGTVNQLHYPDTAFRMMIKIQDLF
jgi:D-alanyl-D-alanine carboxypeptidase